MDTAQLIKPGTLSIGTEVLQWARTYLVIDNENIHRPYGDSKAVCPFVKPSIEKGFFYMVFHPEIMGPYSGQIAQIMIQHIVDFETAEPFHPGEKNLKTLLVVFPGIPEREAYVLDHVQENIKSSFVKRGLMIGQFHKRCETPSVHNPAFHVSISPHPLMAIRYMQPHDILFLKDGDDASWFDEYNRRFGEHFRDESKPNKERAFLLELYKEAKRKFTK